RLTGCQNISPCKVISPYTVYATDWDILLETSDKISDNIKYVGIKSHSFEFADKAEDKNTIKCEVNEVVEGINGYTIIFNNKKSENINLNSHIWFKIKKEVWNNKKNNIKKLYVKIPQKSILLLE
ncbi:hypothetical protein J2Z76_001811, partial [Sedimentibacter acidaminivorans]|nr:hypothetical protein [Sedimentibacter acidaminivorans]